MEVSGKPPFNLKRINLVIRLVRRRGALVVARLSESPMDQHDRAVMAGALDPSCGWTFQSFKNSSYVRSIMISDHY